MNSEYYRTHREELLEKKRAYYKENREVIRVKERARAERNRVSLRDYQRDYRAEWRRRALDFLGGKCIKCGYDDWRALQIDHINGGGRKEHKQMKSRTAYHMHVIRTGGSGYQVLCANCNQVKKYEKGEGVVLR